MVHPVPDPTAQTGFSSVSSPLYTAEHKSYTDSEKTQQKPSLDVDPSTCNNQTSDHLSLPCFDKSQEISSPLSDINCENGHRSSSSLPVSLLHKEKCERIHESPQETPQETFDDRKLNEHDHMKVTVSINNSLPEDGLLVQC